MTLQQLYEELNGKQLTLLAVVNGFGLPVPPNDVEWSFRRSTVPTLRFTIPNPPPAHVVEHAPVSFFAGFNGVTTPVFVGEVASVSPSHDRCDVHCAGESRRLDVPYLREVIAIDNDSASAVATALLDAAGVTYYFVDLPAWQIGTPDPVTLQFQSYSEAVNRVAEVDGSGWYEMPDGQLRVELRDPIPGSSWFREYFSGELAGMVYSQPGEVSNSSAQPRLRSVALQKMLTEVRNRVTVRGAVDPATSEPFESTAQAASPWIRTPPTYIDFFFSNELIQSQAKAVSVAVRHLGLTNRLQQRLDLAIDGDPEIFLGATVRVIDPQYTGIIDRYVVEGYTSRISDGDFSTELDLRGGFASGTTPQIAPVAAFTWKTEAGLKLRQVVPGGKGVLLTFDGGSSRDFDGTIASYAWSDTKGNAGTGRFFTVAYDPDTVASVTMTLTVTDDDGLTDATSRTIDVPESTETDPLATAFIAVAADSHGMLTADGGETWTDKTVLEIGFTATSRVQAVAMGFGATLSTNRLPGFQGVMFGTDLSEIRFSTAKNLAAFVDLFPVTVLTGGIGNIRHILYLGNIATSVGINEDFAVFAWAVAFDLVSPQPRGVPENGGYVGIYVGDERDRTNQSLQFAVNWGGGRLEFDDLLGLGNYPIKRLRSIPALVAVGGDTRTPASLLRRLAAGVDITWVWSGPPTVQKPNEHFTLASLSGGQAPPPIDGDILTAVLAAGAGHHAVDLQIAYGSVPGPNRAVVLFDTGVDPRCWVHDFATGLWSPVTGLPAGVDGVCLASYGSREENVLAYVVLASGTVYSIDLIVGPVLRATTLLSATANDDGLLEASSARCSHC